MSRLGSGTSGWLRGFLNRGDLRSESDRGGSRVAAGWCERPDGSGSKTKKTMEASQSSVTFMGLEWFRGVCDDPRISRKPGQGTH